MGQPTTCPNPTGAPALALAALLAASAAGCGGLGGGYTAEGILSIGPEAEDLDGNAQTAARRAANVALEVKSEPVLARALETPSDVGLEAAGYAGPQGPSRLAEDLVVEPVPGTALVRVGLTASGPVVARDVVTRVLDAYVEHAAEQEAQARMKRMAELQKARDALEVQARMLADRLRAFLQESGLVVQDGRDVESTARLEALRKEHAALEAELTRTRAEWEQFKALAAKAAEEGEAGNLVAAYPEVEKQLYDDAQVASASGRLGALEAELEELRARLGPDHTEVKRLENTRGEARRALDGVLVEVLDTVLSQFSTALERRYEQAREAEAEIQDRLAEARARAADAARDLDTYREMEAEFEPLQNQIDAVVAGIERLRIEAAMARPPARVLQYPPPPAD